MVIRSTDKKQAKYNMRAFWDKKLGRAVVKIACQDGAEKPSQTKKLLSRGASGKLDKNTKAMTPNKGGAKMSTKMKNNTRGVPGATETSMTFNPNVEIGGAAKHTRKVKGKGRGNSPTKTNYTDKNNWGFSPGLAVADTRFIGAY